MTQPQLKYISLLLLMVIASFAAAQEPPPPGGQNLGDETVFRQMYFAARDAYDEQNDAWQVDNLCSLGKTPQERWMLADSRKYEYQEIAAYVNQYGTALFTPHEIALWVTIQQFQSDHLLEDADTLQSNCGSLKITAQAEAADYYVSGTQADLLIAQDALACCEFECAHSTDVAEGFPGWALVESYVDDVVELHTAIQPLIINL